MFKQILGRVKPLSIFAALSIASSQGCAVGAEVVDCEVLQGTGINQFELQFLDGDEAAHAGVELCVVANNYDACDKLESTADEGVFVVSYDAALSNVRSLHIRPIVKAASASRTIRDEAADGAVTVEESTSTRRLKSAPGKGKHVVESSSRGDGIGTTSSPHTKERIPFVLADAAGDAPQLEVVTVSEGDRGLVVIAIAGSYPIEIAAQANEGRFGTAGSTEIASCQ